MSRSSDFHINATPFSKADRPRFKLMRLRVDGRNLEIEDSMTKATCTVAVYDERARVAIARAMLESLPASRWEPEFFASMQRALKYADEAAQ